MPKRKIRKFIAMLLTITLTAGMATGLNHGLTVNASSVINDFSNLSGPGSCGSGFTSAGEQFRVADNLFVQTESAAPSVDYTAMRLSDPPATTPSPYTMTIYANGTSLSTFTFQDLGLSSLSNPSHYYAFQNLTIEFDDALGNPIGSPEDLGPSSEISQTSISQLSSLYPGHGKWNVSGVASVKMTFQLSAAGAPREASNLAFENITYDPASYTINSISDQTMNGLTAGYTAGSSRNITVTKSGTGDLTNLTASITGNCFDITQPAATTLNSLTSSTSFSVKTKTGLLPGAYTETVTVSAVNMTPVTFTVTQVVSAIAGSVTITGNPAKTYNGSAVTDPAVTKNGTGAVTYTYYADNSGSIGTAPISAPSAAGTYWVKASVAQDANHSVAEDSKKFVISPANITGRVHLSAYTVKSGQSSMASATGLPSDATYSYVWKLDGVTTGKKGSVYSVKGSYGQKVTVSLVANGNYTGTLTSNEATITEYDAPTGRITVGANGWDSFLSAVTFDRFFPNTQMVTIDAADTGGSGVKSIQYYQLPAALALENVKTLTGWSDYSTHFTITAANAEKSIVYAKITDNAGNVTYLSSDGMTFDTQAPTITTDYTKGASAMTATVTDGGSGVDAVKYTVNGGAEQSAVLDANGKFSIASLPDGKYNVVIYAADKVGNTSDLTVNVVSLYNVIFKLYDGDTGTAIDTKTVEYGGAVTPPANPTRAGFAFKDWDKVLTNLTANTTVNATWGVGGVTVTPYSGTYDGTAKPAVTVAGTLPGDTITYSTNGADYAALCPQYTNAGSYPVYVRVARTGYTTWESGLKTAAIAPKAITADMISVAASSEYTGAVITPSPVVTYGTSILKNGSDYSVSYSNNIGAGLASVNITGKGNYSGTVSKNFGIYTKNTDVKLQDPQVPAVVVSGLQDLYHDDSIYTPQDQQIEQNGGSVKIELSVKTQTGVTADETKIEKISSGKTIGLYLDLTLSKTVLLNGQGSGTTTGISHTGSLLTVVIPIPSDMMDKQGIALYRVHQGNASIIPIGQSNAVDGEYCTIDAKNITLYVKNFSTYAIGYNTAKGQSQGQSQGQGQSIAPNANTGDKSSALPLLLLPAAFIGYIGFVLLRKRKCL